MKKWMKENWHILVFCLTLIYYAVYFYAFWHIFTDNALYRKYFKGWYNLFWFMFLPNLISQIIAWHRNKKSGLLLLVFGLIIGFATHILTVAQGV